MFPMTTVPAVHEKMDQGASEQRKPDQHSQHMRPVLRKQEGTADNQKADESQTRSRSQKASGRIVLARMFVHRHAALLLFDNQMAAEHAHRA